MRDHLFHLETTDHQNLQSQIRTMLIDAIVDGRLPPDSAVPSCRELARQLSISRNTVMLSYEKLVDDGFLYARERSGYFVSADFEPSSLRRNTSTSPEPTAAGLDWSSRLRIAPAGKRHIVKPDNWRDYTYPFIYGQLDDNLFPCKEWRECVRDANSKRAIRAWSVDSFDGDDAMLVEQLRTHLLPERGVCASADETLITLGTQNSLYLVSELLMSRNVTVGIEEPGYADARHIFESSGARIVPIPLDDSGMVLDERFAECDIVYVTPSHQAPTTLNMPLERRQTLLHKALQHDIVVIEDDYDSETNFLNNPIPALKSLDTDGRVIYVSSLSKTLAPGLRIGYMVAPAPLVTEARALRRLMLRHPPSNNQHTVALFIARGYHDTISHRLSRIYRERWHVMVEALRQHLGDVSCTPTYGGSSFWARLPPGIDSQSLVRDAADRGVLIEDGDVHFCAAHVTGRHIRLAISSITENAIEPGIRALRGALDAQTAAPTKAANQPISSSA